MDHNFSEELKDLVRRTRETAIAMGYDYISTIHFFIADAESKDACSIFKFSFKDELSYFDFRKKHTVTKTNLPAHINESLPLTLEAEKTIRLAEKERILFQQYKSLPCHFFIAALKK